jgi:transcriptional regulator with XRE-family HTH domain
MKKDTELRWQIVMKTRGINLTKLAKTAGLHASQISNWLNGHSRPSAVNVIKLCKAISKMTGRNYEKILISLMYAIEIDAGVDV